MGTLMITGSRDWVNWKIPQRFVRLLHVEWSGKARLIEGEAMGADLMLKKITERLGWVIEEHPVWKYRSSGMSFGQAAYARNGAMVNSLYGYQMAGADVRALALWKNHSRGTENAIGLLRARSIEPVIFYDCRCHQENPVA